MSEKYDKIKKVYFNASTPETIDKSVLSFVKGLNLFTDTNEGWREVPVVWGTAERAFQVKNSKDIRDKQGLLRLPIITVSRTSITKDKASKGVFQGNVPEANNLQGGSLVISKTINPSKTNIFERAQAKRLFGQESYPHKSNKTVYTIVSAPMPVNVTVTYEIMIRTEYQQQMNNLILPFITKPGTINYINLQEEEHRFEGFIDENFTNQGNLNNFSSDERKFETKIGLRVVGYLVGQEKNGEKPYYSIEENFVEVKIPKEKVLTTSDPIPEGWIDFNDT